MYAKVALIIADFHKDVRGAVAIAFSGVLLLILLLVGVSVDYIRWNAIRDKTQSAMDAAILAAGRTLQLPNVTEEDVLASAYRYYDVNKATTLDVDNVEFSFNVQDNKISGLSQQSTVKTMFLGLFGFENLPVNVASTAQISSKPIEVSLMLDITGSMGVNNKLQDLQDASRQLIDIVLTDGLVRHNSRIALVPFSTFVNVSDTYFTAVTGDPAPGINNEYACVVERNNANRYTDDSPDSGGYFDSYYGLYGPIYGNALPVCPTLSTIMPLSDNKSVLKSHIDALQVAPSSTAGHLGTAWSWYTISDKWGSIWPTESRPAASGESRKITVLMTDGNYNAQFSGNASRTQGRELCDNMKASNITVYAVGFDVAEGSAADLTMGYCASSPDHHYNAADGAELIAAYNDIARKLYSLRLTE